jgi:MoaA/NifB/PqqE/SkfB family radical SAM enzyme
MDLQVITPISTPFNLKIVQVEISSKCVLKCPRCPRTELDLPWLNQEMSLDQFKLVFTKEVLAHIEDLVFCGHTGDALYATEFLEIVEYVKQISQTRLQIIVNGSYKKSDWWARLGHLLTEDDSVTFSVDGWDNDSNNKYRVNSDFNSIVNGIRTLREHSPCYINWSTIYFNFNQNHIDHIAGIAQNLGCDSFQLVKSAKFDNQYQLNGVDPLKPSVKFVSKSNNYERNRIIFRRENPFVVQQTKNVHPFAKCLNGAKEINVTVDGYVFPCGWFNTGYQHNEFFERNKEKINAYLRPVKDILEDEVWNQLTDQFNLGICQIKCKSCQ